MNDPIQLSAKFAVDTKQLILKYEVVNRSSRDAYLLNRLYRSAPSLDMNPDVIYVHLDSKTETVLLSKKLEDLPQGISVTAPIAPFVTPLRAGASFREEVHVPIPVEEYRQYPTGATAEGGTPKSRIFKNVRFTLGYYWRPEGTKEETSQIQGTEVIVPKTPPGKAIEFGRLEVGPTRLDIPVLEPVKADWSKK